MRKKIFKQVTEVVDSGFSSNVRFEGDRLLNKDGTFNVRKEGLGRFERFDIFHTLIWMSWPRFLAVMLSAYLSMNLVFTTLYLLAGIGGLGGIIADDDASRLLEAFFFSAQTLTTVGYGRVNPIGLGAEIVATCEAFVGLLGFALATGLLYARFSRPRTMLVYSDNAVIAPFGGEKGLMVRVANKRDSQMIDVTATLIFSWVETTDAGQTRRFYNLDLEYDRVSLLSTSWTIVHPIVESSPLHGLIAAELELANVEIIVLLRGYDETHSQEVHSRSSYISSEIVWGARFTPVLGRNGRGQATIALDKLSLHEPAPLP